MTDGIRKVLNPLEAARKLHKLLIPANSRFIEETTGKRQHGTSIITFSVIQIQIIETCLHLEFIQFF